MGVQGGTYRAEAGDSEAKLRRPHCATGKGGTRGDISRRGRGLGGLAPEASLRYGKREYKVVRIAIWTPEKRLGEMHMMRQTQGNAAPTSKLPEEAPRAPPKKAELVGAACSILCRGVLAF